MYSGRERGPRENFALKQQTMYAFIVANTSLTYDDIAKMTDEQIGAVRDQFKQKEGQKHYG